ncbi:MAG: hypothetical protein B7Y90_01745 [Alphaproteobacteria bacterium 32-64-14]|nr:MAG: hypothetical protein B7Y90_01745 [Alphaproteobacteria bacterium 32-64-14]
MTRSRDLGPVLAIAGAAVAVAAIIAGFIVVGGPGNARDIRLDEQTSQHMLEIVRVAQCAFSNSRTAAATYEAALRSRGNISQDPKTTEEVECATLASQGQLNVLQGRTPPEFGDVSYDVVAPDRIAVCGNFRTAYEGGAECTELCLRPPGHMELGNSRSVGINCFEQPLR